MAYPQASNTFFFEGNGFLDAMRGPQTDEQKKVIKNQRIFSKCCFIMAKIFLLPEHEQRMVINGANLFINLHQADIRAMSDADTSQSDPKVKMALNIISTLQFMIIEIKGEKMHEAIVQEFDIAYATADARGVFESVLGPSNKPIGKSIRIPI